MAKAPANVIEEEREKEKDYMDKKSLVEERINSLKNN
ncbi:hypothetical protein PWEIH_11495 [Listeria weihenstephanensis FSL R9-0317]|nr:hypothetical protein PWEIH_11495 [Listeria weihenstephanensis FSL R9-0317]